jgi:hypothetical protein
MSTNLFSDKAGVSVDNIQRASSLMFLNRLLCVQCIYYIIIIIIFHTTLINKNSLIYIYHVLLKLNIKVIVVELIFIKIKIYVLK